MKRGAENQLTKDSLSDDEDIQASSTIEMPGTGFRKADHAALASRPMRGLPKRTQPGNSASAPALGVPPPAEAPKFMGFSGFGSAAGSSTSNASSPFSFKPPSANPVAPPTVSTTASNTAKMFGSFLGTDPTPSAPSTSSANAKVPTKEKDPGALKYYTSLRGLNISVIAAITKATQDDPFKDVAEILEQYKTFRSQIQRDYDSEKKPAAPAPSAAPTAPKPTFSMPSAPTAFAGFGAKQPTTTPSTQSSAVPAPTTSSAFSLTPSSTPSASKSPFSFPTTPAPQGSTSSSPFSFPSPGASTAPKESSTISPFAAPTSASSLGSGFSFGAKSSPPKTSFFGAPSTSLGGSTTFGTPTSDSAKPSADSPSAFNPFKSSTSEATKPAAAAAPAPASASGFAGFSGFGTKPSPGGSLGNPVGFSFGAPSKTPDVDSGATSAAASGSEDNTGAEGEAATVPKTESFTILGNNPHDDEGEGEEDEETIYSVKLKVYRLKRADDKEGTGWKELGYGVLRLKKHKETGKRRMLLRNSSTGKIHINFNLYSGMKPPTLTKKSLTFMGFEGTTPQNYNVRLQSEGQAAELKTAIEKEVAEIP